MEKSTFDKIKEWFAGLFGGSTQFSEEKGYVAEAQNFRDLYIVHQGSHKVRVIREIFPKVKETLVAEYENFETPICEYVNDEHLTLPAELTAEALEKETATTPLICAKEGKIQKIEAISETDYLWKQLTGKLRPAVTK